MKKFDAPFAIALGLVMLSCAARHEKVVAPCGVGCQKSSASLFLTVDPKTVNIEEGRLRAPMDGPICSIKLRVTRKRGMPAVEKSFLYTGPQQELRWGSVPRDQIDQIELRITDEHERYLSVKIEPWSITFNRVAIEFAADSTIIRESEVALLNDTLHKLKELFTRVSRNDVPNKIFIAGQADAHSGNEKHMALLRDRAQAIANWFIQQGACIPIAFASFDGTTPGKMTADEMEQATRRVNYVVAVEPPMPEHGAPFDWTWIYKGC